MSRAVAEWRGATDDSPVPGRVRVRVYMRDGGCCKECGRKIRGGERWITDHTIAIINSGENRESNLRTICDWCDKNTKTPADVAEKSKVAKVRGKHLGIKRKSRPMDGSKGSKFRKRMDGRVELR